MNEETYQIKISCGNCGRIQKKLADIPKGKEWFNYINNNEKNAIKCDYCGCYSTMNIMHIL